MLYRLIVQCEIESDPNEIIGAKEAVSDALELMGCYVNHIKVMPLEEE